jgi:hypothetical protein
MLSIRAERSAIAILGYEKTSTPKRFAFVHRGIDHGMQH